MTERVFLYRHYNKEGKLLYVGISLNTLIRLTQHRGYSPWYHLIARVEIEEFPSRAEAVAAEDKAIQTEHPSFNIARKRHIFDLEVPRHVILKPMYHLSEVEELLDISHAQLRKLMNDRQIGYVDLGVGSKGGSHRILGWQLVAFLEKLEKEGLLVKREAA